MENKFVRWVFKNLPAVYLGFVLVLGIGYIFNKAETVRGNSYNALSLIFGAVLLEAFLLAVYKLTENLKSEKPLRNMCYILLGFAAVGLTVSVVFMKQEIISDLANFHHAALNKIETGEWSRYGYFSHYPFQKGWLAIIYGLYKVEKFVGISDLRTLPLALNVIMLFFSAVFAYKTSEKLMGLRASVLVLLTICVNPVYYISAGYCYTFVPGLFFIMLVIFLSLYDKWYCKVLLGFFAAVGYDLRATVIIAFVAVTLYAVLRHEKGFAIGILLSVFGFAVGYFVFKAVINSLAFETTGVPYAATHWIVMGTTGMGGIDNNIIKMDSKFESAHEMISADIAYIIDYYKENGASRALWLWNYKLSEFLGEATPRIVRYNSSSTDYNTLWRYLSGNEKLFTEYFCEILRLVSLVNGILAVIKIGVKKADKFYPVFIFLFGYVLFYTFWECGSNCGSRYFFLAMPVLQAVGVYGLVALSEKTKIKTAESTKRKISFSFAALLAVSLIVFESVICVNMKSLTAVPESKTYTAASNKFDTKHNNMEEEELSDTSPVTETFTAYRSFDNIELKFNTEGSDESNIYLFELLDGDGNVIREKSFKSGDVEDKLLDVGFDEVKVKNEAKFTVRISVSQKHGACISVYGSKVGDGNQRIYFNGFSEGSALDQIYFVASKTVSAPYYSAVFVAVVMIFVFIGGLVPILSLTLGKKASD